MVSTLEVDEQIRRETEQLMQAIKLRYADELVQQAQTPQEMREALKTLWYRALQKHRFDDNYRIYCEQLSLLIKRAANEQLLS